MKKVRHPHTLVVVLVSVTEAEIAGVSNFDFFVIFPNFHPWLPEGEPSSEEDIEEHAEAPAVGAQLRGTIGAMVEG